MSSESAATRLLTAMALPSSLSAMMTDFFTYGGRGRRPTVATVGEEDERCPTTTCFELEHWPSSKSSTISALPSIEHQEHHDNDDYDLYSRRANNLNDQHDNLITRRKCPNATIQIGKYILENSKTIPSPPTSPIRPIRRADSFDSVQSSSSTGSSWSTSSIDSSYSYYNDASRRGITIGSSFAEAWSEEPASRKQGGTKRSKRARVQKRRDSDEASELCWREYWG